MESEDFCIFAKFVNRNEAAICTKKNLTIVNIYSPNLYTQIAGQGFIMAISFGNVIAAVSQTDAPPFTPFFLLLYHKQNGNFLQSVEFPLRILDIQSNSRYFFVSLETVIQVFDVTTLKAVETIERHCSSGLFSISDGMIAWSDDAKKGEISFASVPEFAPKSVKCHKSSIRQVCVSSDSQHFATACTKGTLIRVFEVGAEGRKIREFRRGFSHADVTALCYNDSVCCCCSERTIHIFLQSGTHCTMQAPAQPLCCRVVESSVEVIFVNGTIGVYPISKDGSAISNPQNSVIVSNVHIRKGRSRRTTL